MQSYRRLNTISGWIVFLIAAFVYLKTMEPSASFWDCGEFISSAYRLQVGHQPGAPLFIMLGKVISLVAANPSQVAFYVNAGSAIASAATVMFLFWTITALALKLVSKKESLSAVNIYAVLGAGFTGALAFTFSDTFWFSAVEAEVYALSMLCTAIVFWAALKWEAQAEDPFANRWLLFIAYIIGLSVGVHLLNLLAIPAIVLIYYFRKSDRVSTKGIVKAIATGCFILAIVQYGVIQYLIYFAARFDIFFVNSLKLGFGSGALFFSVLLIGALVAGILYSIKKQRAYLNLVLLSFAFILLGYSSYLMIVIRSNARTAINISSQEGLPDNAVTLLGYLGRDQYGDRPLLYGPYFDATTESYKNGSALYRKGDKQYEPAGTNTEHVYNHNTILPRIYSDKPEHQAYYRDWLGLGKKDIPDFKDNLVFLTSYQAGFMYLRYFMWNFAGKQDDEQGLGNKRNGNWLTGIKPADAAMLGNQNELPVSITKNEGYNRFFALPFILGLAGMFYQYRRNKKDAGVIALLFFCTGLAIVLYLNQSPLQVRERDYAYVGSFYAFAIWIGLGVFAIKELLSRISVSKMATGISVLAAAAVPVIMGVQGWDDHDRSGRSVAHDMAVNYLQSCAPNAILFTNADNDTYPLWFAQHVEGIRTDVRIVNLQLLYNDSYVDQAKTQLFDSAPLPVTMPHSKYVKGVRDYLPYADYGFKDSVELNDLFEVMTSDNEEDKVEMQSGEKLNFLPAKKFKLTVNAQQVIKSGTVKPEEVNNIADKLEWTYPKNYVTRSYLAMIDILVHNNWKRPIYFTGQLPDDSYMGLDNYLFSEGYTYRLMPLKRNLKDNRSKEQLTNTNIMYNNLMSRFDFSSFNKASYLDPESRRLANVTWSSFNTLAANLYSEGKVKQAGNIMNKALKVLPLRNYSLIDTANKARAAENLYKLHEVKRANLMLTDAASFIDSELKYYSSLNESDQLGSSSEIRYAIYVLQQFKTLALANNQPDVVLAIDGIYRKASNKIVL